MIGPGGVVAAWTWATGLAGALAAAAFSTGVFAAGVFAARVFAAGVLAGARAATAFDAGLTGADLALALTAGFTASLAVVLAETVFLGLVGFTDGFFAGIYWLRGEDRRTRDYTDRRRLVHPFGVAPRGRSETPGGTRPGAV